MTTSTLTFRVTPENDNSELTCRASNPWFTAKSVEDKRIIHVACAYMSDYCLIKIFIF